MSKYGQVALAATMKAKQGMEPKRAWKKAATEVFPNQPASRAKGCPRCAFLGLAEDGLIVGVPSGKYTQSVDNKQYALNAIRQLHAEPSLANDPRRLWQKCISGKKTHNGQIDVVLALWESNNILR